jgi:hypothetical protein
MGNNWIGANFGLPRFWAPNSQNPAIPKNTTTNPYLVGKGSISVATVTKQVMAPIGFGYTDQ